MTPTARDVVAMKLGATDKVAFFGPLAAGAGHLAHSVMSVPSRFMSAARGPAVPAAPTVAPGASKPEFQDAAAAKSKLNPSQNLDFASPHAPTDSRITQEAGKLEGGWRGAIAQHLPGMSGRSGAGIGALLGAGIGALAPGKDDDGESRGVLSGAIRGALGGGIAGGAIGAVGRRMVINPVRAAHGPEAAVAVNKANNELASRLSGSTGPTNPPPRGLGPVNQAAAAAAAAQAGVRRNTAPLAPLAPVVPLP